VESTKEEYDLQFENLNKNKMKVLCINSGDYLNISQGRVYDVIEENADGFESYLIIANNGGSRRYHKRYFEVVNEEPVVNIDEIDEVGVLDEEEVPVVAAPEIAKFSVSMDDDNNADFYINGVKKAILYCGDNVAGNCGTLSYDGLNSVAGALYVAELYDRLDEAIGLIIAEISDYWDGEKALIFFSTNREYEEIWDIMDTRCSGSTDEVRSPNSGLQIKVWWIDLTD
jgi:hypothetical protein